MALAVVRANSQYAEATSSAISNVSVMTLAAWFKPAALANGTVLGIGATGNGFYGALGMNGSGNVFWEHPPATATAGLLTAGVWGHIAGVTASASSYTAYANGVAGSTVTNTISASTIDRVTVGGLLLNGSRISFSGGDIAECAMWSVALTAPEVAALAAGFSPLTVRPASLVCYAPLRGNSPERELIGRREFTYGAAGASPTLAPHVRVFMPGLLPFAGSPTAAGGARALDGASSSTSASTGDVIVAHSLTGTSAGASASTGDLIASHPVAGTSASTSTSAGDLLVTRGLAATSAATSASTGDLIVSHPLAGLSTGTSTTTGAVLAGWSLASTSPSTSTSTGAVTVAVTLAGTSAAAGTSTGDLTTTFTLAGTSVGTSNDAGTLDGSVTLLAGISAGTSTSSGAVDVVHTLAGTSASTSTSTGAVDVSVRLMGLRAGTSTSTGALNASLALQGFSAGTGSTAGSVALGLALAGLSAGASTTTGALTIAGLVVPVGWLEGGGSVSQAESGLSVSYAESSGGVLALIE